MYQVIARKYRPHSFSDLIGQEHVRATLENAIARNRIAHGYIFAGQRGTGKTTVARILARCLNCEKGPTAQPCMDCAACRETAAGNCVDVIEIDAASNRGINEMRELRENVRYRPARDRYKVFIIDEAHQITSEAFNALLKTLEEPPEWVVFVLCTTEAHKIPTTIASRCQQFSFRSVDFEEVVARMEMICRLEGIEAEAEALLVLAQAGEGSVRDSLSALDQAIASCGNHLKADAVRDLLGMFSVESLSEVARALSGQDSRRMLEIVDELERNGRSLQHFCRELARYFRNLLVVRLAGAGTRLVAASEAEQKRLLETAGEFSEADLTRYLRLVLDLYRELQYSPQPRLHLEIGLLRLVYAGRLQPIEEALASLNADGPPPPRPAPPRPGPSGPKPAASRAQPAPVRRSSSSAPEASAARSPGAAASAPPPAPELAAAVGEDAPLHDRLYAMLASDQLHFAADAVKHCSIEEAGPELRFTGPREFSLAIRSAEVAEACEQLLRRKVRVVFAAGEAGPPASGAPAAASTAGEEETTRRALSHPTVRRFQETFPGSHVRTVRNLKQ